MPTRSQPQIRALLVDAYGDWRRVKLASIDAPEPGPGEVLIEAQAASLNFADLLMIEGKYQVRPALPFVPGRDVAGRIVSIGEGVTGFAVGDRVAAHARSGAFAELAVTPAAACVVLPSAVSFEAAAASATIFATVVAALGMRAKLQPNDWVLITGAAGGVGSAGIQYARVLGARVAALVSSSEKENAARELGAEVVVRSDLIADLRDGLRQALAAKGIEGVAVVIDVVGGDTFDAAIRCVAPEGRLIVVGFASGRIPQIAANYLLLKDIAVVGSSLGRLIGSANPDFRRQLQASFAMLADGRMKAPIEGTYPLSDFQAAAARIAERKVIGKIVLLPRS
jgi:NADPH2:quinone reductase